MLRDQLLVLQNYQHSRCHSQALTDAEIIERLNKVSRMICDAVDGTLTPCEWCGLSLMKLVSSFLNNIRSVYEEILIFYD